MTSVLGTSSSAAAPSLIPCKERLYLLSSSSVPLPHHDHFIPIQTRGTLPTRPTIRKRTSKASTTLHRIPTNHSTQLPSNPTIPHPTTLQRHSRTLLPHPRPLRRKAGHPLLPRLFRSYHHLAIIRHLHPQLLLRRTLAAPPPRRARELRRPSRANTLRVRHWLRMVPRTFFAYLIRTSIPTWPLVPPPKCISVFVAADV